MLSPPAAKETARDHIKLTAKAAELPENPSCEKPPTRSLKSSERLWLSPAIRDTEGGVELTFGEKPRFCFEIGSDQRPASDDGDCGDCCDCVGLEDGRNVIILSDGMGTGRRAAVDSAMATDLFASLICSGLSCEAALRTVNTRAHSKERGREPCNARHSVARPLLGRDKLLQGRRRAVLHKARGAHGDTRAAVAPGGNTQPHRFFNGGHRAARGRHGGYDIGRRGCGRQRVDIEAPSLLAGGRSGARRGADRRRLEPPQRKKIRRYDRDMRAGSRCRPNRELTKPAA